MKAILLALICLIHAISFSQVGINLDKRELPNSILEVKNSKKEVLLEAQSKNSVVLKLKMNDNDSKFYGNLGIGIINPSAQLDASTIKIRNLKEGNLKSHNRILLSDAYGNINFMDYMYFVQKIPEYTALKYISKTVLLDSETKKSSITEINHIRLRYNNTKRFGNENPGKIDPNNFGYIQFQVKTGNSFSVYWEKSGSASGGSWARFRYFQGSARGYSNVDLNDNNWVTFQKRPDGRNSAEGEYYPDNFNANNRDIVSAIIILHNSQKIYRATFLANPILDDISSKKLKASVSIFIEELEETKIFS